MNDAVRQSLEKIGRDLANAKFAIAFTGAGISTESGLPDYRGATGLWKNRRFEELANIDAFMDEPVEFWEFYGHRIASLHGVEQNAAHLALQDLLFENKIKYIITQNVDGLHVPVEGLRSHVIELHGSLKTGTCVRCIRKDYHVSEIEEKIAASEDGVPRCDNCNYPIKPGVVLFGEALPSSAIQKALYMAQQADFALCLGSSLQVMPAAAIPGYVLDKKPRGRVAIINKGKTHYDGEPGVIKVEASLAEAMPVVLEAAQKEIEYDSDRS